GHGSEEPQVVGTPGEERDEDVGPGRRRQRRAATSEEVLEREGGQRLVSLAHLPERRVAAGEAVELPRHPREGCGVRGREPVAEGGETLLVLAAVGPVRRD